LIGSVVFAVSGTAIGAASYVAAISDVQVLSPPPIPKTNIHMQQQTFAFNIFLYVSLGCDIILYAGVLNYIVACLRSQTVLMYAGFDLIWTLRESISQNGLANLQVSLLKQCSDLLIRCSAFYSSAVWWPFP
jgi:hypothetical protein